MKTNLKKFLGTCFIYIFMMVVPFSCNTDVFCNNSCGCDPLPPARNFEVKSFSTKNLNTSGQEITTDDFLPYNQVYKQISINGYEFLSFQENEAKGSFPGVAYACSIAPPSSEYRILGMNIYNLKEVTLGDGTVLKVGDLLNDYFEINSYFDNTSSKIEDFFMEPRPLYLTESFRLFFMKNPEKETIIEFSIQFSFEKNKQVSINNTVLKIR